MAFTNSIDHYSISTPAYWNNAFYVGPKGGCTLFPYGFKLLGALWKDFRVEGIHYLQYVPIVQLLIILVCHDPRLYISGE